VHIESAHAFASTKRFVIERELGHGGMGIVYQALDLERNALVALKALTQRDAVNIYRLKNEFRQLADLSHPNLVTLHELCNEGGWWFFTMELVQGKSFDAYVADDHPSTPPPDRSKRETAGARIVRDVSITLSQRAIGGEFPLPRITCNLKRLRHALRQLVEAVAALHDAGKLHRDIKPSNVLVTTEGRVVVLDFGLVSNTTSIDPESQDAERTVGGCMFGTPAYMSPEQAAGEAVTMATDWYAVGTMLYEALTGQLPFDGSVLEILRQKEEGEPVPPSEIVRGVPDDLDQLCRDLLRRDPNRRPPGHEILRYLTGQSAPPPVHDAQSSSVIRKHGELFVGRERHLAELRAAFEDCRSGKPITVLVHGLSGMGKSALVRCFANELIRNDEAVVLRGRCYERETVPYKAFDNIIDALSRYMMRLPAEEAAELLPRNIHALAVLFPVLRRVKAIAQARRPKQQTADARELRNQAFAALKDLLLRITDFHPLVVNIDDLQWADMDSARMLAFLMSPPDPPPLLLVGAYRRDEAENSVFLRHIMLERGLSQGVAEMRELAVDALAQDEAVRLATALLRDQPGANALCSSAIAAEADGVPFFIAELVQHLKAHHDGGVLPLSMQPISLEQVILERVAGMPPDAQRLLQVLSVAAGPLEQGVAIDAAGLTHGDRTATLTLRAARLIRTRGTRQRDTAETYHDRVRETVASNLEPASTREIHARIALAMERHDVSDPERLVVHYTGAGNGMRAGETAVQAAHAAAQKLAFNRAADLFKKAIDLQPEGDASRRELHRHLGDALGNGGKGAQAAEAYMQAAKLAGHAEASQLQTMAAQQYLRSGRTRLGIALTKAVLGQLGIVQPRSTAATAVQILARRAQSRLPWQRESPARDSAQYRSMRAELEATGSVFRELGALAPLSATYVHGIFLQNARRVGTPFELLQAIAWQTILTAGASGASARKPCARILAQLHELATQLATPEARAVEQTALAATLLYQGRFAEAIAPAAHAETLYREHLHQGTYWERNYLAAVHYLCLQVTGDLPAIAKVAPQRVREASENDDVFSTALLLLTDCISRLASDRPQSVLQSLQDESCRLDPELFTNLQLSISCRTVDALLYLGDGAQAFGYINAIWPQYRASVLRHSQFTRVVAEFARGRAAAASAHTNTAARGVALGTAEILERETMTYARTCAKVLRASLAKSDGQTKVAVELLTAAEAEFASAGLVLYAASAQLVAGTLAKEPSWIRQSEQQFVERGVVQPLRWALMWIPVPIP
jgi:serine/threonine protein kinase/tetratricopeptide (TPR) repeat protein